MGSLATRRAGRAPRDTPRGALASGEEGGFGDRPCPDGYKLGVAAPPAGEGLLAPGDVEDDVAVAPGADVASVRRREAAGVTDQGREKPKPNSKRKACSSCVGPI